MSGLRSGSPIPSRRYERALLARQLVVTLVPTICFLLRFRSESPRALLALALAATTLNFTYYLLLVRGRFPTACRWARLGLDCALWTLLLHYTGGPGSFFYVGYLAEIALAAVAVSPEGCLVAAALSGLGFATLLGLDSRPIALEQDASRILGLILIGVVCWALARRFDIRHRHIEHLYRALASDAETVRREAAELHKRLEQAEAMSRRGIASAEMLHEWRNTVHGIGGFLSLLKDDLRRDRRSTELVTLIESAIRGMHETAEELLERSGKAARHHSLVDLGTSLREAIAFSLQGTPPKMFDLAFHQETPAAVALANREALRGAFVNLIRNSLQAIPDGGRVDIRCRSVQDAWIQVEIEDTGPGIPEAIRHRLFEPFVKGGGDGMGLGLAISRRVIEAGGGSLVVGSTSATGTTMTVRVPAHNPSRTPAAASSPARGQLSPFEPRA